MADELYDLVFRGEVLEGQHVVDVRLRLGRVLKQDPARVAKLFAGQSVVIKKGVPREVAARYQGAFRKAGARLRVRSQGADAVVDSRAAPAAEPAAQPSPAPVRARTPASIPPDRATATASDSQPEVEPLAEQSDESGGKKSLAERLAEVSTSATTMTDANLEELFAGPEAEELAGDFEVAPEGAPVLLEIERPRIAPVQVDTTGLTVAEAGEDLGEEREFVELEIDLSALSLADVGEDLGAPRDQAPQNVDTSAISLAPEGGEFDRLPVAPSPPAPDTSHLSLEAVEPAALNEGSEDR